MGEIRRVLNSFLQMIEQDDSHSIVMAATNHPGILDRALFRRFDDILHFEMPDIRAMKRLGPAASRDIAWSDRRLGGGTELCGCSTGHKRCSQGRTSWAAGADPGGGDSSGDRQLKAARGRLAEQSA